MGRLFLTPEVRAGLETRRQAKVNTVVAIQDTPEIEEHVASYVTINGLVVRSSGTQTVFVNGTPYSGTNSPKGLELSPGKRPGEVMVVPADGAAPVPLKVGQSLDKTSLAIDDAVLRSGTISIGVKPAKGSAVKK